MLNDKTTFTLTLGKLVTIIIAVVGFAFTIGMTYQQVLPNRELQKQQTEEIADIKLTLAKVSTILENMEKEQSIQAQNISALQGRSHVMNTELQLISSSIKEMSSRDKRRY